MTIPMDQDKKDKIKTALKHLRRQQRIYEMKVMADDEIAWYEKAQASHRRIEAKYGVKSITRIPQDPRV